MTISEVPTPSGGTDLRGRVAAEVRAWMARRRITVPKAAAIMGTSTTYLYRRLSGETALDIDDLERLAIILSVPVIALLPTREQGEEITGRKFASPRTRQALSSTNPALPGLDTRNRHAA